MNKKAVVFALDAVFAVLIATSIMVSTYVYLQKTDILTYNKPDLYRQSADVLTILEKNSYLKDAVALNNINQIDSYLGTLPERLCANITIYDKNSVALLTTQKSYCESSVTRTHVSRVFVYDNNPYYATIVSWYI